MSNMYQIQNSPKCIKIQRLQLNVMYDMYAHIIFFELIENNLFHEMLKSNINAMVKLGE